MLDVQIDAFSYADTAILKSISFQVTAGEHLSILGESGSGKSTLLHLIYGLLHLENGSITYNGKKLLGPTKTLIPGEPFMKLVAQEYNIIPYSTVSENIGAFLSRNDREKDQEIIDNLMETVGLTAFRDTLVNTLSGGQKQRVALAKALADEPKILLLDEPFSNIDPVRKNTLRRRLFAYLKSKNISCISATHDTEEALAFSDRILMLNKGQVERYDTPETLYATAENAYQAQFFGDANFIEERLLSDSISTKKRLVYPSQLRISEEKTNLSVTVTASYFKGNTYLICGTNNQETIYFHHQTNIPIGELVYLTWVL